VTPFARAVVLAIAGYQRVVSPHLPGACRFAPTCSEFARTVIADHGILYGVWLTLKRVARCQPLFPGGYDPPPARRH